MNGREKMSNSSLFFFVFSVRFCDFIWLYGNKSNKCDENRRMGVGLRLLDTRMCCIFLNVVRIIVVRLRGRRATKMIDSHSELHICQPNAYLQNVNVGQLKHSIFIAKINVYTHCDSFTMQNRKKNESLWTILWLIK